MTYGTTEHEEWLIRLEREEEAWGPQPDPMHAAEYGGCGCLVSQVAGGDCEHTIQGELEAIKREAAELAAIERGADAWADRMDDAQDAIQRLGPLGDLR